MPGETKRRAGVSTSGRGNVPAGEEGKLPFDANADPRTSRYVPLDGALKVEFIHVFFGAIDPAVSKNDFVVHQTNFFVTGLAKVHTIGDLLAV